MIEKPKGILRRKEGEKRFQLSRRLPAPDLAFFIEYYWIINWNLTGQEPYLQEVLPHPCFHLVLEKNHSRIVGIMTTKFSYLLEGRGNVFGVKFKPGAFYPFVNSPASNFTDSSLTIEEIFGIDSKALEDAVLDLENDEDRMIGLVENVIRPKLPERDENIEVISQIIECIVDNREIIKVDDLVTRLNLNKRSLQRLFNQYVGVSPKWVIKRYRLHEAAEQLADGETLNWPGLALDLGYFDQAHFIKDFKNMVGRTPTEYAKTVTLKAGS